MGQGGNTHGDSDCRDAPNTEPLTRCEDTQAGHSRDATAMATAFEPLNRSLETFLTRLSRTNERSEKSRRVFKKPRCYKDESYGCIDTWIEVMKLHFESNRRMNLAVASKFIDGVKNDELRTMLATHYTPLSTNAPTPEELRLKSKEYLLLKPPSRSG